MNIVLTGASTGVGRETARILASIPGTRLVIVARNNLKLQSLAGECNLQRRETAVFPVAFDLAKGEMDQLAAKISLHLGQVDILINNAGAILNKPLGRVTSREIDDVFSINFKAPYLLIQSLLPYFNNGAHIVNTGSMGGVQGSVKFPGLSVYSASKAALAVLTESLAVELAGKKVAVNCLAFGSVDTAMLQQAFPGYQAQVSAESMAGFVADFAINGSKLFNGKVLPVSLSTP